MPVLMVGDLPINLIAVQPSGAALTVMNSSGQKFWAAAVLGECPHSLVVKTATGTYTIGNETLVAQVSGIGTCETMTLAPGCYRAEVKGGSGGSGGGTNAGAGAEAISKSYSFSVNQNTDIMAFVGGNGNAGSVNTSGVLVSGGGGGGGGGTDGLGGALRSGSGAVSFVCAGGGGGAPSGAGGAPPPAVDYYQQRRVSAAVTSPVAKVAQQKTVLHQVLAVLGVKICPQHVVRLLFGHMVAAVVVALTPRDGWESALHLSKGAMVVLASVIHQMDM